MIPVKRERAPAERARLYLAAIKSMSGPAKAAGYYRLLSERERVEVIEGVLGRRATVLSDGNFYIDCPGKAFHSGPSSRKDTMIAVKGKPHIVCMHKSCAGVIDEINRSITAAVKEAAYVRIPHGSNPAERAAVAVMVGFGINDRAQAQDILSEWGAKQEPPLCERAINDAIEHGKRACRTNPAHVGYLLRKRRLGAITRKRDIDAVPSVKGLQAYCPPAALTSAQDEMAFKLDIVRMIRDYRNTYGRRPTVLFLPESCTYQGSSIYGIKICRWQYKEAVAGDFTDGTDG